MTYTKDELSHLKGWIYSLISELEDLEGTDPALMFGIEVGDDQLENRVTLPIPGKFAAQVKALLTDLYNKDILLLTNLTENISKLLLAEQLAADYKQVNQALNQWNQAHKKMSFTFKAFFGKSNGRNLPVPARSVTSVVVMMITDLLKEKAIIEQRIALLAELDTTPSAVELIQDLSK